MPQNMCRSTATAAAIALASVLMMGDASAEPPPHHEITVRHDPASGELRVNDRIAVEGRDALVFGFATWLSIDSVRLAGRRLEQRVVAGGRRVDLPDHGRHEVEIILEGRLPRRRPPGGDALAASASAGADGSYLPADSGWLPLTDDRRMTWRLDVQVPAPYRAIATGRREKEQVAGAINRAIFTADDAAEPPSLFVGPYDVVERVDGNRVIRTYFHAELAPLANEYLDAGASYLDRYSRDIGAYPYQEFDIVSAPLPVGLGFPGLTYDLAELCVLKCYMYYFTCVEIYSHRSFVQIYCRSSVRVYDYYVC